jgi:mannose-6-phosphate isomerase-like protein (cupin superfamily)
MADGRESGSREYMEGKVSVRRLEVVTPPISNGGRLTTAAGDFVQVANGDSFEFLAYLDFAHAGARRGSHYHAVKREHLYVIRGALVATYRDMDDGKSVSVHLTADDLVRVEPRCAHVYTASEYTEALEFSSHRYDPGDTFAHEFPPEQAGDVHS